MRNNYWLERLVKLRRIHLLAWQLQCRKEIHYRRELAHQYEQEKLFNWHPIERIRLVRRQAGRIQALNQRIKASQQALRHRQAQELFDLLRLKMCAKSIAIKDNLRDN